MHGLENVISRDLGTVSLNNKGGTSMWCVGRKRAVFHLARYHAEASPTSQQQPGPWFWISNWNRREGLRAAKAN
ncbi:hypothetical protein FOPE_02169 [Fonsecaea pedrosoi]|nr:hypothetical protein FOPE_02169 [Fonsecaea pedrosoi]